MNLRSAAQLFKMDVEEMFNAWDLAKPLRTGMPHASAILAPENAYCLRSLVLAAHYPNQVERPSLKPWTANQNQIFLNGWTLHEKYQTLFQRFGRVVEVETSHYDETRLLHFTPDAIVEHLGENMVVEIKGYKAESFDKMDEHGPAPEAAHHQANFYMHLLDLQHALILVENKNNQAMKVWAVEYNQPLVNPYLDRIYRFRTALHKAENDQGLPDRMCKTSRDRNAEKCGVCKLCFKKG